MKNLIEFINPDTLFKSPAFSQVAVISGNSKTVYVGGQNAVDRDGKLVGKGDLEKQSQQVLSNIDSALKAAGATFNDVVKFNIFFAKGQSPQVGFKVFQPVLSELKTPPLVTAVFVDSLANPDYLLEIEVMAVIQ